MGFNMALVVSIFLTLLLLGSVLECVLRLFYYGWRTRKLRSRIAKFGYLCTLPFIWYASFSVLVLIARNFPEGNYGLHGVDIFLPFLFLGTLLTLFFVHRCFTKIGQYDGN